MFKHLLVPTDGSELSQRTVERAVSFAKEAGARVTFFYAQHDYTMAAYTEAIMVEPSLEQYKQSSQSEADKILDRACSVADASNVLCYADTSTDLHPYQAIIDAAIKHGCDLIFMSSHGRKGIMGMLLGSETQKVLTHSTIPVLVYRGI